MKTILSSLILLLLITSFHSCKSTKEATAKPDPAEQNAVAPAQATQEDFDYYSKQPKRGELDPADVETVVHYAKEKASLVCKIHLAERQAEQNPDLAEENKRKVITLEQNIKALDIKNEDFMDSDAKWHYFNKVYEKEIEKCQ